MALADSVGAAATVINLPEDAKGTTKLESKTNFISGVKEGTTVIATATPVHRGRRTQVWQARLETRDGKLVALVTQTQMVLLGRILGSVGRASMPGGWFPRCRSSYDYWNPAPLTV
jgi:acyl-coenzyme A thioesterase PaaI-like protein